MTRPAPSSPAELLREAFDATFADQPAARVDDPQALVVRVGGEPAAVALSQVSLVLRALEVVPVPGGPLEQIGIGAMRGELLTVLSLALLLGRPDPARGPRAVLIVGRAPPVGLAVDALEGLIRLPSGATGGGDDAALRAAFDAEGTRWLVVDVDAVLRARRRGDATMGGEDVRR